MPEIKWLNSALLPLLASNSWAAGRQLRSYTLDCGRATFKDMASGFLN